MASIQRCGDKVESCSRAVLKLKEYLPASAETRVTNVGTELYHLSKSLQHFGEAYASRTNEPYREGVRGDAQVVLRSITHTVRNVERQLAPLEEMRERGTGSSRRKQEAYIESWRNILEHFANEGAGITGCESLQSRLETYRTFTDDLLARLEGDGTSGKFKDLQFRIKKLLREQDDSLKESLLQVDTRMDRLSLDPPPTPSFKKQTSWERPRPKAKAAHKPEAPPPERPSRLPPRMSGAIMPGTLVPSRMSDSDYEDLVDEDDLDYDDLEPTRGLGEPIGYELDDDIPDIIAGTSVAAFSKRYGDITSPPLYKDPKTGYFVPAPDPPQSSNSSVATPSAISSDSSSSVVDRHWLSLVFGLPRSSTPFRNTGLESACYGKHTANLSAMLKNDFEELSRLPFDDGKLQLRIYIRHEDRRCRLYVRQDRNGQKTTSSQPVTNLRIIRRESCLQLCEPDPKRRQVMLWLLLNFPTYERMVLFWCSFHALKGQDNANPITKLEDAVLDGEDCLFSSVIVDDGYQHALHILRDKDSRGVRLQASALSGVLKRTPIWTAFITHQIMSPTWAQRVESRKIHLSDLTRFIFTFTDEYQPQMGRRGESELFFTSSRDAKMFEERIGDIANGEV